MAVKKMNKLTLKERFRVTLRRFQNEEEGQSLVEYGLLISLVALVAVIGVTVFGRGIRDNLYGSTNSALSNLPTS